MISLLAAENIPNTDAFAAGSAGFLGFLCVGIVIIFLWFLPPFIAFFRGHPNAAAIFLLTFLLGWLFVPWVIALVWSFTSFEHLRRRRRGYYLDD